MQPNRQRTGVRAIENTPENSRRSVPCRLLNVARSSKGAFRGALVGLLIASECVFAASPMLTPAQFSVTPSGAASYAIPIAIAPGVAGVEPKISVTYGSQSSNGIAGVGWAIEGISVIARCPRTKAQDGTRGAVSYDNNDRYCLDGTRLIAVNGVDGANGTEYRTELESFSRVISYGQSGNGPLSFKVWTKSGLVLEYGNTADSRLPATGKTSVAVWSLNRTSDSFGNYVTYSYTTDTTLGSQYLQRIDYAGTPSAPGGASPQAPAPNSVTFEYEARPDISKIYQAGSVSTLDKRLKRVAAYRGTAVFKDYTLTYDTSARTQRSRLASVMESDAAGTSRPAIGFTAGAIQTSLFSQPAAFRLGGWGFGTPPTGNWDLVAGDFNGDGKTDFAYVGGGASFQVMSSLSNGDGTFNLRTYPGTSSWNFGQKPSTNWQLVIGDFNGDGLTDFAYVGSLPNSYVYAFWSNGDGTFTEKAPFNIGWGFGNPASNSWFFMQGDFDGDGLTDFAFIGGNPATVYISRSNGDGTFQQLPVYTMTGSNFGTPGTTTWDLVTGDFDGDGRTDFLFSSATSFVGGMSDGNGNFRTFANGATGWSFTSPPSGGYMLAIGDFNGDGKTDFGYIGGTATNQWFHGFFSNGDGTFRRNQYALAVNFGSQPGTAYSLVTGDFDGDGKTDFGLLAGGTGSPLFYPYLGKGDDNFRSVPTITLAGWTFSSPPGRDYSVIPGDFNGDGQSDFALVGGTGDSYARIAMSRPGPDVIGTIQNGYAAPITLNYKALTDSTVYTRDSGANKATYPMVDLQFPIYAVSSASIADGIGGTLTTSYSYAGLKSDSTGRGLLGFRTMQTNESGTNIQSTSTFRQDWPYIGMPASVVRKSGSTTLSSVSNQYSCKDPSVAGSSSCSTTTGKRYFPYASQVAESSWELNGGASLPTITTTNAYDDWGNATAVTVTTTGGYSKSVSNTYATPDITNWRLGRLLRSQVTSTSP